MRILLTENETGVSTGVEQELRAAGYEIVRCLPAMDPDDECVVFRGQGVCPLHGFSVDAVVDVRSHPGPETAREIGTACAVRNEVPLIVVGSADRSVFPWSQAAAVCDAADVIEVCESVLAPIETTVARAVARAAGLSLRADGVDTGVVVSIANGVGDTGIFVSVPAHLSDAVAKDVAAAVRQAVAGYKDFPECPRIVVEGTA